MRVAYLLRVGFFYALLMRPFTNPGRGYARISVFLLILSGFPLSASAWNAAGHRLSAAIAWQMLTPETKMEIVSLLDAHPSAEKWAKKLHDGEAAANFFEAAIWPDDLRRSDGDNEDDATVHRDWHYLDWPMGEARSTIHRGKLDAQLSALPSILVDRSLSLTERSIALAWLVHLVADAHTPLHTATWKDASGAWTYGGNRFVVIDVQRSVRGRASETNLHRFWDELPGPPWLQGKRLQQRALALLAQNPAVSVDQGDAEQWIEESHRLARQFVRPPGADMLEVTDHYRTQANVLAARRVAEAGVRLGRWLNRLLSVEAGQSTDPH